MYALEGNHPFYRLLLSVQGTLEHLPDVDLRGPAMISLADIVVEHSSIYYQLLTSHLHPGCGLSWSSVSIMSHEGYVLLRSVIMAINRVMGWFFSY